VSLGWVAGSLRARLLTGRCLGAEGAREVAAAPSLREAAARLARSEYGREGALRGDLAALERSVAETVLLRLRLLAAWLPPGEVELMRVLAAWFELANVEDRLAYLAGGAAPHPFPLGSLAVAWGRTAAAQTPEELRQALAASAWGDPGSVEPATVHRHLRLVWARRLLDEAPETADWVAGALALLVAREVVLGGRPFGVAERARPHVLGSEWERARTLPQLAAALPARAAWPLAGLEEGEALWRGEVRWWRRVERDAEAMLHAGRAGRIVVIGAAALLAADARRVLAALEAAARGANAELEEAFGAGA
jgi:hypothetical protein